MALATHRSSRLSSQLLCAWHSTSASMPQGVWPVVIAGAGPTGLTLSTLLSQYHVPNLVLERANTLTDHPQAHFINCRTMEVFRGMPSGFSSMSMAVRVSQACPPLQHWRKFIYCHTMCGLKYGEVDHFKGQTDRFWHDISPEGVAHLPQNKLLPLLLHCATSAGGTVHLGHSVESFSQHADGVQLEVKSNQGRSQIKAGYLVAADGVRSAIRQQLGIQMEGQPVIQELVNIHFMSRSLGRRLAQTDPAMLYFVFNESVVSVVVAHDLQLGEFVAQVPIFTPMQTIEDFTEPKCRQLVAASCGENLQDLEIRTVKTWKMGAQVAETFQAGRVFLAGDAAHEFPPAGGFGMNTGIQDAHNLAWKLAHVINRQRKATTDVAKNASRGAQNDVLASYSAERRQIAVANACLSEANFREALRVPQALGLSHQAASVLSTAANIAHSLSPGLGKGMLRMGLALGHAGSGANGWKGWRRKAVKDIIDSGASLRLQYPREDLGFVYNSPGACIRPPTGAPPSSSDLRDAPYVPSFHPGARMPHIEIRSGQKRLSLLDFVGPGWLFVVADSDFADNWLAAADVMASQEGLTLTSLHVMWSDPGVSTETHKESSENCSRQVVWSDKKKWVNTAGNSDSPFLVRPDGHLAWRSEHDTQSVEQMQAILRDVFRKLRLS